MKIVTLTATQTLPIRHAVLWPNKSPEFCRVEGDHSALHYGIEMADELVCVGSVYIGAEKNSARLRKFATLPAFQKQGLGSCLLQKMLDDCRQRGLAVFWCDARESAIVFYQRFGLAPQGERFYKEDEPYFKMRIDLQ